MYLLVYAIRWVRQHQQENLQIYCDLTRLVRGGNKTCFISLGLPRFSNPRLQLQQGNIRVLCPHCGNLTHNNAYKSNSCVMNDNHLILYRSWSLHFF
jgi:hypothetical protein